MSNKQKVVIVGTAHPYRGGGISTFNERLALAWQDEGYDVCIYNFILQYPKIFFPGKFQITDEAGPANLKIYRKVNSVNPANWYKVGNELRKMKPDLVIFRYWIPFMGPCFGTIARIIRRNHHTRIVAITDNVIPHESKPMDKMFSKYFIQSMDAFVAMSRAVLADLEKFDRVKPKAFNPHPLYDNYGDPVSKEEAREYLGWDKNRKYILFFGFVRDYKGLDLLIKAMADDELRKEDLFVYVAGEFYADKKQYMEIAADLNVRDKVMMPDTFIPNQDIKYYFCAADLVVQPYKSATQSGVTQVATHFNKPMIITDVGGLSEFVPHEKTGFVVKPEAGKIAAAIKRYFKEDREREFVANIDEEKKKYSWQKLIATINSLK